MLKIISENKLVSSAVTLCVFAALLPFIIRFAEGWNIASYNDLSNAGDWLGGVSAPILSLAGFIMMYAAYSAQREELRLTREEMEASRLEAKTQNETLKRQEFETTFFHMLELHHQIVNSIVFEERQGSLEPAVYSSRRYFEKAYAMLGEIYSDMIHENFNNIDPSNIDLLRQAITNSYVEFYKRNQIYLGHYFRNAYHILRLLDESSLTDIAKINFSKLYAAQFSADELHLLFYNCVCGGYDKFKELAIKYDIFDSMDTNTLIRPEHQEIFPLK